MRKLCSKGISLLLVLVFLLSICVPASATMISTRASNYLNKYDGVVTREGGGTIKISFTVIGTRVIDEIGASQIVVEKQDGNYWIPEQLQPHLRGLNYLGTRRSGYTA